MNDPELIHPENIQHIINLYQKVLKEIPEDWKHNRKVLTDNLTKLYQTLEERHET